MSGSKSLTSFFYRFFFLQKTTRLEVAVWCGQKEWKIWPHAMPEKWREQQQRKEKERSVPLRKDSKSQSKRQSHLNKLFQNWRKGDVRWGERKEKKGQLVKLVGDQIPSPEAFPRCKRGRSKGEVRRGATSRRAMEMGWSAESLRERRSKETTHIEYLFPFYEGHKNVLSPWGVMAIKIPRMKRFLKEKRMEGEKELVRLFVNK